MISMNKLLTVTTNSDIQSFSNVRLRYLRLRKYVRSVNILTDVKCSVLTE